MPGLQPDIIVEVLNQVLVNAEACMLDGGRPAFDKVFHHHGPRRPPGDCCDYLAIFIRQIRVTTDGEGGQARFPASFIGVSNNCSEVSMAVDASIALNRPCFPTLQDNKANPFPGEAAMQNASDELAVDARTLWCCMIAASNAGQLLPPEFDDVCDIAWGPMTPFRGGACAGWQWDFVVQMPTCCWDAPDLGSG